MVKNKILQNKLNCYNQLFKPMPSVKTSKFNYLEGFTYYYHTHFLKRKI